MDRQGETLATLSTAVAEARRSRLAQRGDRCWLPVLTGFLREALEKPQTTAQVNAAISVVSVGMVPPQGEISALGGYSPASLDLSWPPALLEGEPKAVAMPMLLKRWPAPPGGKACKAWQGALSRPRLLVRGNPPSGHSPERTPAPPPAPAGPGAGQRRSQPTRAAMAKRAISRELKPISVSVSW